MKIDSKRLETLVQTMKIEKECISRSCGCNRDCGSCDLVQDYDHLVSVYSDTIMLLEMLHAIDMGLQLSDDNITQKCVVNT